MEAKGGKKRKRLATSGKTMGLSKRGHHGQGCSIVPKVARVIAAKVAASTVGSPAIASKSKSMVAPTPLSPMVGGAHPTWMMPTLADLPILQVISDEEDEDEEEEKEVSEGFEMRKEMTLIILVRIVNLMVLMMMIEMMNRM